jgi:hypothetical protein
MDYGLKIAQSEAPGVKSGHAALKTPRPLYPQKRTSPADSWMSVLCHKRTHALQQNPGDSMEQFCRGLTRRRGLAAVPHTQSPQAYPSLRSRERT